MQKRKKLREKFKILTRQTEEKSNQKIGLERSCYTLQERENLHIQRLAVYNELESMGFGLNRLRILHNTISELSSENGITYDIAIEEFFRNFEKQYDVKLRMKGGNENQQRILDQQRFLNNISYSLYYIIKPRGVLYSD